MSAAVVAAAIAYSSVPAFEADEVAAKCKLQREGKYKVPGGAEAGPFLLDVQFIHTILTDADAEALERWMPGSVENRLGALGEDGDGSRGGYWKAKDWEGSLQILTHAIDGTVLFDGAVTVKRATFDCSEKAATLKIYVRLHAVTGSDVEKLMESGANREIYYKIVRSQLVGGGQDASDTPLFGTKPDQSDLRIGDIAVGILLDQEYVGLVAVIKDDTVVLHQHIDGTEPVEIPKSQLTTYHHLAGGKGGPPFKAIRGLAAKAGRIVTAQQLLTVLEGTQLDDKNTWILTSKVTDQVLGELSEDLPVEV